MTQVRLFFSRLFLCTTLLLTGCYVEKLPAPPPSPYALPATPHPYSAPQQANTTPPVPAPFISARPQAAPHAARSFSREVRVGLLLPLSGKDAALGKLLLDAATLGLEDAYSNPTMRGLTTSITLLPHDTGDSPVKAKKAAAAALEQGATLLIGPLYADATAAISPLAQKAGVPVLSFSNSPDVAGSGVYLFGFMIQQQAAHITKHVVQLKKKHLAALLPNNNYGTLIEEAIEDTALKTGLSHVTVVKYETEAAHMPLIAAELNNVLHQKTQMTNSPAADALLMVEGGARLEILLGELGKIGIAPPAISYFGIGTWLNEELLGNSALKDAAFASTSLSSHDYIIGRMQNSYNIMPPHIAALAYDAPQLLAMLLIQEGNLNAASLTRAQGYQLPATGLTRLNANGTNIRSLGITRFGDGGFEEIRPAPRYLEE